MLLLFFAISARAPRTGGNGNKVHFRTRTHKKGDDDDDDDEKIEFRHESDVCAEWCGHAAE